MSLFVCRIHPDISVNWKSKGCSLCENDHAKRQEKKETEKKRRAARRNGEEYVEQEEER